MSRYQKGKTNLDFTAVRDSEWQWHQLGHMQVCTSLQTDNHASTPPLSFFTGRMPFLPPNQQRQSTDGKTVVARVDEQWLAVGRCIKLHTRRIATDDATPAAPLHARTCLHAPACAPSPAAGFAAPRCQQFVAGTCTAKEWRNELHTR